jgi:hypothetical protein
MHVVDLRGREDSSNERGWGLSVIR